MALSLNSATPVHLAAGVSVFMRAGNIVQFGMDATRTGIIETPFAAELCPLIDGSLEPIYLHQLTRSLSHRIGEVAAESLVADLLAYRILVPATSPQILVLGTSPLAAELKALLKANAFEVKTPFGRETEAAFITTAEPSAPLVFVDRFQRVPELSQLAKRRPGPTVAVSLLDSRVLIGPLRTSSGDPCPACVQGYLRDRDAGWDAGITRLPQGARSPDPVVLRAGAAAAAVFLRRVADVPDPPGVSAPHPAPGEFHVVDPFGSTPLTIQQLRRHPDCPVCF